VLVVVLLFPLLLMLAFFNPFIFPDFIRDSATTRANRSTNQRAFSAAHKGSGHRAACGRAANNLRSGVMLMVMGRLGTLGLLMALSLCLLRKTRDWQSENANQCERKYRFLEYHRASSSPWLDAALGYIV
jgi:hypothetical protein